MNLKQTRYILAAAVAGLLLSGCGGSGGNGSKGIPPINSVNPVTTGTLQFAVGTANLYGTGTTGLNVVSTYRQANGLSNVLVDTPTITGPFTLPASVAVGGGLTFSDGTNDPYSTLPAGPSIEETTAGGTITGTSQTIPIGSQACDSTSACTVTGGLGATGTVQPNTSTFGQAGGVFVNGISPGNSTTQGVAMSYVPYTQPMYDTTGSTYMAWGGPPAFDPNSDGMGARDGLSNLGAGVVGVPEGFTTFENVVETAGTYTLSVVVPTGFNGPTPTSATVTASAKLTSTALLPAIAAPVLTLDGTGGGTVTVGAFPAGVTEEYIQIVDTGSGAAGATCQGVLGPEGQVGPVYYTIIAKAAGAYKLPDTDGPNINNTGGPSAIKASESICTAAANTLANSGTATPGDSYTVQAIGTDYDMYDATYPISKSPSPTIANASGQADITVSPAGGPFVSP